MENGQLVPSIDIVQRLMKVFTISADQLLNESEKMPLLKSLIPCSLKNAWKDLLDGKIKLAK
jgi:hypothetical protein